MRASVYLQWQHFVLSERILFVYRRSTVRRWLLRQHMYRDAACTTASAAATNDSTCAVRRRNDSYRHADLATQYSNDLGLEHILQYPAAATSPDAFARPFRDASAQYLYQPRLHRIERFAFAQSKPLQHHHDYHFRNYVIRAAHFHFDLTTFSVSAGHVFGRNLSICTEPCARLPPNFTVFEKRSDYPALVPAVAIAPPQFL